MSSSSDNKVFRIKKDAQKLRTIINAEGREIIVQGREDEEQIKKLQEISDLLVAAGYFRAQIKGLSPFDKVVGGICWCIDSCNVDIDAELLFQEDLSIGQKISLTEKIVIVLPEMQCPHRIEPHQIQGLDFIHIFPVIQWLVKRAMESREERYEYLTSIAVNKFHTIFHVKDSNKQIKYKGIPEIIDKYKNDRSSPTSSSSSNHQQVEESTTNQQLVKHVENILLDKDNEIINPNSNTHINSSTTSLMSSLKFNAEDIINAFETYSKNSNNNLLQLEKNKLNEKLNKLKLKNNQLKKLISSKEIEIKEIKELNKNENNKLEINNENQIEIRNKLKQLYETYEILKDNEKQFKQNCKIQLIQLQNSLEESSDQEQDDLIEIKNQVNELSEKINKMKIKVAEKSRSVAVLERRIDQVPGRDELAQYQRRFLELYTQIAAKHKETKQFYNLYNTLNDSYSYLNKELGLLNSILDNYPEAMTSQSSKEQFIEQFENIVEGVRQNKYKVEQKRNSEKFQRDQFSNQLSSLLEQQRQYVLAQKQLSSECQNYEILLSKIKQKQNRNEQNS